MRILNKNNWVFEWNWRPWWSISFYFESAIGGWEFSFGIFGIGPFIRYNTKKSDAIFEKWEKEAKEVFKEP